MANTDQEKAKQENIMANGPVSAGASNQDAPIDANGQGQQQQPTSPQDTSASQGQQPDYNKMLHTQNSGISTGSAASQDQSSAATSESALPSDRTSGSSTGGINTSNSTVSSSGSSGGSIAGGNETIDRGSEQSINLNQNPNTQDQLDTNSQSNSQSHTSD
jgi:hypothetical protein